MALRISEAHSQDETLVLRLEGRIIGQWVMELETVCNRALAGTRPVVLDFAQVSFVDKDGVELLRHLISRRIRVVNCSPFIALQLDIASVGGSNEI